MEIQLILAKFAPSPILKDYDRTSNSSIFNGIKSQ